MRVLIAENDYPLYTQLLQRMAPDLQVQSSGDSEELSRMAGECPVWLGQPDLLATLMRQGHKPAWLQSTWAGITPLLAEGLKRDYRLTRAVGIFGQVMAEYVLTYMLGHEREVMVRLACSWVARMEEDDLGVAASSALASILSKLGATPVDVSKVNHGDSEEEDPDDEFFGRPH